jgi:hypothetical protein
MCLRFQFCTHQRVCILYFLKKSQIRCTLVWSPLKGQCHEIFCFWFFSSISFLPAPEYPIRRYSQVKVHHRYQRHRSPAAKLPPVSTTPAANLPPVSTTPAANFATSFTSVVDTGGNFAWGKLIHEKTRKISWRCPFKPQL